MKIILTGDRASVDSDSAVGTELVAAAWRNPQAPHVDSDDKQMTTAKGETRTALENIMSQSS